MARAKKPETIQERLNKTRIAPDLTDAMKGKRGPFPVIIEFNTRFPGGSTLARLLLLAAYLDKVGLTDKPVRQKIESDLARLLAVGGVAYAELREVIGALFQDKDELAASNSLWTENYVFGKLQRSTIGKLVAITDPTEKTDQALIYKIWHDHDVSASVIDTCRTVKSDAARASFAASGNGIVWAVADTGIDGNHPHFRTHQTLQLSDGLYHHDFTRDEHDDTLSAASATIDSDGHGTHVAGILAGETKVADEPGPDRTQEIRITRHVRINNKTEESTESGKGAVTGTAPHCKILSLKVLEKRDKGSLSYLLAALSYIQHLNDYGRNLRVHGVNLSLGYLFNPEWFAAGQSPLCVEVNRLIRSGVVVVVAAGNGGYGIVTTRSGAAEAASHAGTISDPGNAELAITVGSTHREKPHAYGISYFSAKGPTADGRRKPDLVAPGERIVSCALLGDDDIAKGRAPYKEDSGTSMAAPHVSGAIAAFLSVRGEFIGEPERVKRIFLDSATDLGRLPDYQGAGLIDLMRALQSV